MDTTMSRMLLVLAVLALAIGSSIVEAQESHMCLLEPSNSCSLTWLTCPQECPLTWPVDPSAKACFVDCTSSKCQTSCKYRVPNCVGIGATCYDPRFVGGDGTMFLFRGKSNKHYTLVSNHNLQINSHFIGHRPAGRTHDFTWIQALGLLFDSHTFTIATNADPIWDSEVDHFVFTYDDAPVQIVEGHTSSWASPDGSINMKRTLRVNGVTVTIPGKVEIMVSVMPVTEEDNRIHNYQIPTDNCFAHLEVQFKFFGLSEEVEGVLGHTYQPNYQSPVKKGVLTPVMGGEDKYITSSLLSQDCKKCIFVGAKRNLALSNVASTSTLDCTSSVRNGYGMVCRR